MKNYKFTFIASAFAALSLVGCNDLDTEPLGSTITADQKEATIEANPERIKASVAAMPALFYDFGKILGESYHSDFGYPAMMLWSDTRGTDLVSENIGYNWFSSAVAYTDIQPTGVGTNLFWRGIYKQLYAVNNVTSMIAADTNDDDLMFYLAQAYAIRAFNYFTLAQFYQHTYVGNEDKLCVPVITEANADAAGANGCPRSTVAEVYAQIMTDINNAIDLLSKTSTVREDKRYISLEVAYGIRARINLVMNNWAAAASDAENALKGAATPYTIAQVSKPGFSEIEDASWMWGCLVAETDRTVTSGICNFPSHMGSLNYGYASVGAWRYINKSLYNSIPDTDVRKGWWLNENQESVNLNAEQVAYVVKTDIPAYTQVKFGCYKDEVYTSTNANDIPLMRVEEMYLILAEAQAMAGDPAAGAATLENFVKTYRDPAYTCTATTAEAVQNAAWQQRRIELWGEGFSYTDLMRLKKNVDRRGAGFEPEYVFNVSAVEGEAGYDARIFPIPQSEIEGNPMISKEQNNPISETVMPVEDIN